MLRGMCLSPQEVRSDLMLVLLSIGLVIFLIMGTAIKVENWKEKR